MHLLPKSELNAVIFNVKKCLGYVKLKKTQSNWKCIDTDIKITYTLFTLLVSLSLVTMFILSSDFFQYNVDFLRLS